jgi:TatD DNase family protein
MFVDTHCHLNMIAKKKFDTSLSNEHLEHIETIIDQAKQNRVEKIINIGTSLVESTNSINIAKKFENVFTSVGIHPSDCSSAWKKDFKEIEKFAKEKEANKIVGIGEVGLDFYHKPFYKDRQSDAFKAQIELALENDLALIIHVRDASQEVLRILEEYSNDISRGVIHCFSHPRDFANIILDWGFYVGINGPITYSKNDEFRAIVANITLDRIILETDAPFLPPQQHRGKQNLPSYIPIIAQKLAEVKGISVDEVEAATTDNAEKLFRI